VRSVTVAPSPLSQANVRQVPNVAPSEGPDLAEEEAKAAGLRLLGVELYDDGGWTT
jgi:hypothetical protein